MSLPKGIGELHGHNNPLFCLRSGVMVLQRSVKIRLLCKTTKSPGEVTFRCVHSGVSNIVDRFVGMAGTLIFV